jgi:hypothetical protein
MMFIQIFLNIALFLSRDLFKVAFSFCSFFILQGPQENAWNEDKRIRRRRIMKLSVIGEEA